jgi:hypothetical protein
LIDDKLVATDQILRPYPELGWSKNFEWDPSSVSGSALGAVGTAEDKYSSRTARAGWRVDYPA